MTPRDDASRERGRRVLFVCDQVISALAGAGFVFGEQRARAIIFRVIADNLYPHSDTDIDVPDFTSRASLDALRRS